MNARIYLQPDAIPTQEMIRTANRLFRHFGKEVTFLQQQTTDFPDFTMNRLRWAICNFTGEASQAFDKALKKAPNLVVDFAVFDGDENEAAATFQKRFKENDEVANLVLIRKSGTVEEWAKEDQTKAKRK